MSVEHDKVLDVDGHLVVAGSSVLVDGATASVLTNVLEVFLETYRRRDVALSPRIEAAYRAFRIAGDRHDAELRFRRRKLGTSEPVEAPMVGDMTSSQVAARLGVTTRAVTMRAHAYGGRKVAGRWFFDEVDVEDEALRREEC